MNYRLLALDLDGTLLRHDKTVDPRDVDAIRRVREAGVRVTIVTGRLRTGSVSAARACEIEGLIACMEGSHLVEVDGTKTHAHHAIETSTKDLVRDTFAENRLATFVFDKDAIHHDALGEPYAKYVATWTHDMRIVEEHHLAWRTEPLAAVAIGDEATVMKVVERLRDRDELFMVNFGIWQMPGSHAVLVRAKGPTKGTALAELCRLQGHTTAEAVCVGDWLNDVPMFEVAGRSFAMGGAPPAVSAKATDLLEQLTGAGGGIAEAIDRAFGS